MLQYRNELQNHTLPDLGMPGAMKISIHRMCLSDDKRLSAHNWSSIKLLNFQDTFHFLKYERHHMKSRRITFGNCTSEHGGHIGSNLIEANFDAASKEYIDDFDALSYFKVLYRHVGAHVSYSESKETIILFWYNIRILPFIRHSISINGNLRSSN